MGVYAQLGPGSTVPDAEATPVPVASRTPGAEATPVTAASHIAVAGSPTVPDVDVSPTRPVFDRSDDNEPPRYRRRLTALGF